MTAMIDIVFLLLIFFLVTTTFFQPHSRLDSALAIEQLAPSPSPRQFDPAIVDVILMNGKGWFRLGANLTDDVSRLQALLEALPNKADGAYVRVASDAPFESAAQAIHAARHSGFVQVHYVPAD